MKCSKPVGWTGAKFRIGRGNKFSVVMANTEDLLPGAISYQRRRDAK